MAQQASATTDGAVILQIQPIDLIQARLAALEAQQNWLHLEQLRAEVEGLHQTINYLIEYIAERDGAAVERTNHVANSA